MKAHLSSQGVFVLADRFHSRPTLGDHAHSRSSELDAEDTAFIRTHINFPAAQLAKMIGRPEADVRRIMGYMGVLSVVRGEFDVGPLLKRRDTVEDLAKELVSDLIRKARLEGIEQGREQGRNEAFAEIVQTFGSPQTFANASAAMDAPVRKLSMKDILTRSAAVHSVEPREILGESRCKAIAHIRQEVMWLLKQEDRWSLPQIGQFLNRDHTSVLHGVRAHQARLDAQTSAEAA